MSSVRLCTASVRNPTHTNPHTSIKLVQVPRRCNTQPEEVRVRPCTQLNTYQPTQQQQAGPDLPEDATQKPRSFMSSVHPCTKVNS